MAFIFVGGTGPTIDAAGNVTSDGGAIASANVNWETFPFSYETDREVVQAGALRNSFYSSGAQRIRLDEAVIWADDEAGKAFLQRDLISHIFSASAANANRFYIVAPIDVWDPRGTRYRQDVGVLPVMQATNTSVAHITNPRGGNFVQLTVSFEEVI